LLGVRGGEEGRRRVSRIQNTSTISPPGVTHERGCCCVRVIY
jgi:hypothetical protein